jgi:hypothetical protein
MDSVLFVCIPRLYFLCRDRRDATMFLLGRGHFFEALLVSPSLPLPLLKLGRGYFLEALLTSYLATLPLLTTTVGFALRFASLGQASRSDGTPPLCRISSNLHQPTVISTSVRLVFSFPKFKFTPAYSHINISYVGLLFFSAQSF